MKALSIRQPWAWAILNAGKDVENRDWKDEGANMAQARTLQNSDILIHTGQTMARRDYLDYMECVKGILHPSAIAHTPKRGEFHLGGIVGIARLAGIVHDRMRPEEYSRIELRQARASLWFFGPYGFLLTNARPTGFVRCNGALGFFNVPSNLVREALGAEDG